MTLLYYGAILALARGAPGAPGCLSQSAVQTLLLPRMSHPQIPDPQIPDPQISDPSSQTPDPVPQHYTAQRRDLGECLYSNVGSIRQ